VLAATVQAAMSHDKLTDSVLPDKLYYKIGEVSSISGLPAYVLRFWETEFGRIRPQRSPSGQRLYRKSDVELILKVKHLLHEKKFTIPGAKQYLKDELAQKPTKDAQLSLKELCTELRSIRKMLDEK